MKLLNLSRLRPKDDAPSFTVDLLYGKAGCQTRSICSKYTSRFMSRMVGKYVGDGSTFRGQLRSAILDLRNFDFEEYLAAVQKVHKGAALRQSRKAVREGFRCKRFVWNNFLPDIADINTSKEVRSGGPMRAAYQRTVDELGGPPGRLAPLKEPECPAHCTYCWGIFEGKPGHKQGEVVTDERLLAYIKFKRQGSLGIYTSILGHGDYLKFGIVYQLHYELLRWIAENLEDSLKGLDYVLYGAHESGHAGLQQWKKRGLFRGAYLVLNEHPQKTSERR